MNVNAEDFAKQIEEKEGRKDVSFLRLQWEYIISYCTNESHDL